MPGDGMLQDRDAVHRRRVFIQLKTADKNRPEGEIFIRLINTRLRFLLRLEITMKDLAIEVSFFFLTRTTIRASLGLAGEKETFVQRVYGGSTHCASQATIALCVQSALVELVAGVVARRLY